MNPPFKLSNNKETEFVDYGLRQMWRAAVFSATALDNGVADWLDIPEELCLDHCITISIIHNTRPCEAFWHPYRFSALIGKALVLRPTKNLLENPDGVNPIFS